MNKLFTVTRRDLSLGQQTAQTALAVGEASINLYRNENFNTFIQTTHVVCLTVGNEHEMYAAIKKLNKIINMRMRINKIHEPDLHNQLTSISFIAHETTGKWLKSELFTIGIDLKLVGADINKKHEEVSMWKKQEQERKRVARNTQYTLLKREVQVMKSKLNHLEQRLNNETGIKS